jgi:hypothetical protein
MIHSAFRATVHLAVLTFAGMLFVTAATSALAIDGRTAVGVCIDSTASGARCEWSVNDKGEPVPGLLMGRIGGPRPRG